MNKKKDKIYIIIGAIALVIAIVCVVAIVMKQYRIRKAERIFDKLAQDTTLSAETSNIISEDVDDDTMVDTENTVMEYEKEAMRLLKKYGVEVPKKDIDFKTLHSEVSEDIYAWIYIPNTHIDYPVFQHPTDNSYYLEHNVDGSEGYPGCIYTENYNAKDFSDPQTVIYGHNMRDTTMFSDLHLYEDEDFFENNRYVYIYTENTVYVYKIFAAYQTDNRHQLLNYDFTKEGVLLNYLEDVRNIESELKIFDDTVEFSDTDKLLTLSTCVMKERQFNVRYLVQALRLK